MEKESWEKIPLNGNAFKDKKRNFRCIEVFKKKKKKERLFSGKNKID